MKYITRKYVDWFGPYQLLDPLEKLLVKIGVSKDTTDAIVEKIVSVIPVKPFDLLLSFRKNLPWNKTIVKIDPWDTWGMDHTLATIIVPMLIQLKKTQHGIPGSYAHGDSDYRQLCFDFYKNDGDLEFEDGIRRWDADLDKMIWSFQQVIEDEANDVYWEPYWEPMTKDERKDYLSGSNIAFMFKDDKVCYKINSEKFEAYHKKMQEGFDLFGKHFRSLWD